VLILLCACYRRFIFHSARKGGWCCSEASGSARGYRADVEHQPEQHEQEYMEDVVDMQLMEEQELQAMDEDKEDVEPRRR